MNTYEVNFDGLIGPSHNYAGLGMGNLASMKNAMSRSQPKKAALQGLYKSKLLADLGIKQAIFPPQERPDLGPLYDLGFRGTEVQILNKVYRSDPDLLVMCYSSSASWTANMAHVTPSIDAADGRVHITPANLVSQFHRSIEPVQSQMMLYAAFADPEAFVHHDPLPTHPIFGDEGSANWMRLCNAHNQCGAEVFVYGRSRHDLGPTHFPARQAKEACEAIARLHGVKHPVFAHQNPAAIDSGVFHNDVIALGNENVLLYHQSAWVNTDHVLEQIMREVDNFIPIEIKEDDLSLQDAVSSYLFNSQLITTDEGMILVAPIESRDNPQAEVVIRAIIAADNPIVKVLYFDLTESMQGGGGPACLRLRVVLTEHELACIHTPLLLTQPLYDNLVEWVNKHYRDELKPGDLADPELLYEIRRALDELTDLLDLGPLYPFQQ